MYNTEKWQDLYQARVHISSKNVYRTRSQPHEACLQVDLACELPVWDLVYTLALHHLTHCQNFIYMLTAATASSLALTSSPGLQTHMCR